MLREWRAVLIQMGVLLCGMLGMVAKAWGVWAWLVGCVVVVACLLAVFAVQRVLRRRFSEKTIVTWFVLCAVATGVAVAYGIVRGWSSC